MLRPLRPADLQRLLAIEEAVHVVPWNEETFKTCFQAGHSGWVAEEDGVIQGFIMVALHPEECHILNICVAHAHQRKGVGRQLLEQVLDQAKRKGIMIAYLEVRKSNLPAIHLYEKLDFRIIAERKGYYPTVNGNEDALIFAKALQDHFSKL